MSRGRGQDERLVSKSTTPFPNKEISHWWSAFGNGGPPLTLLNERCNRVPAPTGIIFTSHRVMGYVLQDTCTHCDYIGTESGED
ncbi:hypothetical protein BgiBS90_015761 [Biomphalaria glabrata]|nr:hypothetical protein BgiBS90_015761 [Biomphalaria glabrata]